MKSVRWGIIGCGDVTEVKSGPAFQLIEDSDFFLTTWQSLTDASQKDLCNDFPFSEIQFVVCMLYQFSVILLSKTIWRE